MSDLFQINPASEHNHSQVVGFGGTCAKVLGDLEALQDLPDTSELFDRYNGICPGVCLEPDDEPYSVSDIATVNIICNTVNITIAGGTICICQPGEDPIPDPTGELEDGYCYLVDSLGNYLVDDEGDYLITLCDEE